MMGHVIVAVLGWWGISLAAFWSAFGVMTLWVWPREAKRKEASIVIIEAPLDFVDGQDAEGMPAYALAVALRKERDGEWAGDA